MARMIFICRKCNSTYGADSGTHNLCPNCGIPLIETSITTDYWRTLSSFQKEKVKHDILGLRHPNNEEPVHKQEEQQYHVRMKFCCHCGKKILEEAVMCPSCGCPVQTVNSTQIVEVDKSVSAGWVILSLLFPLVGGIYFFAAIKTRPKCAVICSIVAIISSLTGLSDFMGGFIFGFLGAYLGII